MLEVLFWSIVLTYMGLLKTYFSPGILKRRENYSQNKNWVLITTLSYSKSCGTSSSFIYQQHLTFDSTEKFCPINSIMCFISIFISGHFESLGVCPPSTKNRGAKKFHLIGKHLIQFWFDGVCYFQSKIPEISKNAQKFLVWYHFSQFTPFQMKILPTGNQTFCDFFVHFFARLHFILLRVFTTLIARTSRSSDQDSLIGKLAFSKKAMMTTEEALGFEEKSAQVPDEGLLVVEQAGGCQNRASAMAPGKNWLKSAQSEDNNNNHNTK